MTELCEASPSGRFFDTLRGGLLAAPACMNDYSAEIM